MIWLLAQVWVWALVALLLGVGSGWWFWARPLRARIRHLEADRAATPPS